MKTVRLAIIGVRGIGRRHAEAVRGCPGAVITACAARTPESVESFAADYDAPFVTTRAAEIAKRADVDAAVICTPNRLHAPLALAMLRAGKDVLLEKPMAMNAGEASKIAAESRRRRRVLMMGHMWRFDDEVNFAREAVASGAIGRVVRTSGFGIHVNWGPSGWFTQKRQAGGGALADMGVHAIDTTRFILGDPVPARVYARLGAYYGDYDVDDTGLVMITWKKGVVSVIECGWRQPHADRPNAGTQVYGERGCAAVFPTEVKIEVGGLSGTFAPDFPGREKHNPRVLYDRQMQSFIECVRGRKKPSPGAEHGLVNQRIIDAAYLSSRTGKAVRI